MIKQYYTYFTILLLTVICFSCCRRDIEEDIPKSDTAIFEINIDWSQSNLDIDKMHRASIIFYPQDGGKYHEFHLEGNLTTRIVELPIGFYSVLVFNETIDNNDWENIQFVNIENYNTISAIGITDTRKSLYSRAESENIIHAPEALAVWSMKDFEVTIDMINYTRSRSKSKIKSELSSREATLEEWLSKLSNIQPKLIFKKVHIVAYVQNLCSAYAITGAFKDVSGGAFLASGASHDIKATHIFPMNNRVWDDIGNKKNGYVSANIVLFGLHPDKDVKPILQLEFLLNNGTQAPSEVFEVSKMIDPEKVEVTIEVGSEIEEEDHPIILPEVDAGGDVNVGDWDEEFVEIK